MPTTKDGSLQERLHWLFKQKQRRQKIANIIFEMTVLPPQHKSAVSISKEGSLAVLNVEAGKWGSKKEWCG